MKKYQKMVQLSLLIAIQIVLTLTPLGFIRLGLMTITLMHIPALIGAIVLGPKSGAALGLVFGISSIISAHMVGTPDVFVFSPLLSGSLLSLVVAIVPRVLFPLITAYLFRALSKAKVNKVLSAGISAGVGTLAHTLMVLGSVYLLFKDLYSGLIGVASNTLLGIFAGVAVTNGSVEAILAVIVCSALVVPLTKPIS